MKRALAHPGFANHKTAAARFNFEGRALLLEFAFNAVEPSTWRLLISVDDQAPMEIIGMDFEGLPLLFAGNIAISGQPRKIEVFDAGRSKFLCKIDGKILESPSLATSTEGHDLSKDVLNYRQKRSPEIEDIFRWAPLVREETIEGSNASYDDKPNRRSQTFSLVGVTFEITSWHDLRYNGFLEGGYQLYIDGKPVCWRSRPLSSRGLFKSQESLILETVVKLEGKDAKVQILELGRFFAVVIDGDIVVDYFQSREAYQRQKPNVKAPKMAGGEYFVRFSIAFLPFIPVLGDNFFEEEILYFQIFLGLWVLLNMPGILLRSKKDWIQLEVESAAVAEQYRVRHLFLRAQKSPIKFYLATAFIGVVEIFLSVNEAFDYAEGAVAATYITFFQMWTQFRRLNAIRRIYAGLDSKPAWVAEAYRDNVIYSGLIFMAVVLSVWLIYDSS